MQIITTDTMDRGLAYGEACFETFRVIDGCIFDWPGHWSRLALGLSEFGILLPQGLDEEVLFGCLREAGQTASDVLIRCSVSGGEASWGLLTKAVEPVVYIQVMPYLAHLSTLSLTLQTWPFPVKKKIAKFTADYADTLRALRGLGRANVLFEQDDYLLATATANIVLYHDGRWCTPKADAGVLPGRVRHFLLQHGLIHAMDCPLSWLQDCEAMVVCNSAVFIQAVDCIFDCIDGVQCSVPIRSVPMRSVAMQSDHAAIDGLKQALMAQEGVRV